VALTRVGTRVIEDLSTLPGLDHPPWVSRYVQGLVDVPFLNLTPGTRTGIIQDERYAALIDALKPIEAHVKGLIEEQQRAEEEQASQQSLKAIQRAFHEALLALPREEYDWFDVQVRARQDSGGAASSAAAGVPAGTDWEELLPGVAEPSSSGSPQRQFFDFAGPLFSVVVSPAASTTPLNESRHFRALPRDRSRRPRDGGSQVRLGIDRRRRLPAGRRRPGSRVPGAGGAGLGAIDSDRFPTRTHGDGGGADHDHGQPGNRHEPGRRQYARLTGVYLRARRRRAMALPLRQSNATSSWSTAGIATSCSPPVIARCSCATLVRLYVKELVLKNFSGLPADQLLERMIELSLYAEEKLKSG